MSLQRLTPIRKQFFAGSSVGLGISFGSLGSSSAWTIISCAWATVLSGWTTALDKKDVCVVLGSTSVGLDRSSEDIVL